MSADRAAPGAIDGYKNNVLIIKNRHPDARKASARTHQRASRAEGPCVYLQNRTSLMQLSIAAEVLLREDTASSKMV